MLNYDLKIMSPHIEREEEYSTDNHQVKPWSRGSALYEICHGNRYDECQVCSHYIYVGRGKVESYV